MQKKMTIYEYSFTDDTDIKEKFYIPGECFIHPENAGKYVIQFFNILKSLIDGSYEITDCKAVLMDNDNGAYGEMLLVRNKEFNEQGVKTWEDKYLHGDARYRWERDGDMIFPMCVLHMNLKHIDGSPFLRHKDNLVRNGETGEKAKEMYGRKFHLESRHTANECWMDNETKKC